MNTKSVTIEDLAVQPRFIPEVVLAREVLNAHKRLHGAFDKAVLVAEIARAIDTQRAQMALYHAADHVMRFPRGASGEPQQHADARELVASLSGGR